MASRYKIVGRSLPDITETISSNKLVFLYNDIIDHENDPNFKIEGMEMGPFHGGKNEIPVFRTIKYKNSLLIYVRGTRFSKISDVAISHNASPEKLMVKKIGKQYNVHGGYLNAAVAIISKIERLNTNPGVEYWKQFDECVFFGHSLGASVALMCAIVLQEEKGFTNVKGFGLAPPRCVDAQISLITSAYCLSVVNSDDPVPKTTLVRAIGTANAAEMMADKEIYKDLSTYRKEEVYQEQSQKADEKLRIISGFRIPSSFVIIENYTRLRVDVKYIYTQLRMPTDKEVVVTKFDTKNLNIENHYASTYLEMVDRLYTGLPVKYDGENKKIQFIEKIKKPRSLEDGNEAIYKSFDKDFEKQRTNGAELVQRLKSNVTSIMEEELQRKIDDAKKKEIANKLAQIKKIQERKRLNQKMSMTAEEWAKKQESIHQKVQNKFEHLKSMLTGGKEEKPSQPQNPEDGYNELTEQQLIDLIEETKYELEFNENEYNKLSREQPELEGKLAEAMSDLEKYRNNKEEFLKLPEEDQKDFLNRMHKSFNELIHENIISLNPTHIVNDIKKQIKLTKDFASAALGNVIQLGKK